MKSCNRQEDLAVATSCHPAQNHLLWRTPSCVCSCCRGGPCRSGGAGASAACRASRGGVAVDGLGGGDAEVEVEMDGAGHLEHDPQGLRLAARVKLSLTHSRAGCP
jgi:hypothetical protein